MMGILFIFCLFICIVIIYCIKSRVKWRIIIKNRENDPDNYNYYLQRKLNKVWVDIDSFSSQESARLLMKSILRKEELDKTINDMYPVAKFNSRGDEI